MVWLICNKMQKQNTKYISEKKQFQYGSICIHKIDEHACTTNKCIYNLNNTVLIIKLKIDIVKHNIHTHEALCTILIKTKHVKKKIQRRTSSSNKYQNVHNLQRKKNIHVY